MKRRRTVELQPYHRSRARLWGYGYLDLSRLIGVPVESLHDAARRGHFNPGDLVDVMRYARDRRGRRFPATAVGELDGR